MLYKYNYCLYLLFYTSRKLGMNKYFCNKNYAFISSTLFPRPTKPIELHSSRNNDRNLSHVQIVR